MTQTSDMTIYQGKGAADFYSYSFENGQLASTVVYLNAGVYGYALTDFLTERYVVIYVDEQEGVVGMVNIAEDMAVFLTFTMLGGEVYAMVVYMPYSYDGNQVNVKRILSSVPKGMSESMDATPIEVVEPVREYIQQFKKSMRSGRGAKTCFICVFCECAPLVFLWIFLFRSFKPAPGRTSLSVSAGRGCAGSWPGIAAACW